MNCDETDTIQTEDDLILGLLTSIFHQRKEMLSNTQMGKDQQDLV